MCYNYFKIKRQKFMCDSALEANILRKYFTAYINCVLEQLNDSSTDLEKLKSELLIKISFMQHERFIHLIVTCLFAILLFMSIVIFFISQLTALLFVTILILVLVIPYIAHYFFLENGVQKLYSIYDAVNAKINE